MEPRYALHEAGPLEALLEKEWLGVRGKVFLRENVGLTGCEVSLNRLPAGKGVPFVHAHRQNEELYVVLRGEGIFYVDGREFPVREGSVVRVAPAAERAYRGGSEDLYFICIQAREGSLAQATRDDGFLVRGSKASWMATTEER